MRRIYIATASFLLLVSRLAGQNIHQKSASCVFDEQAVRNELSKHNLPADELELHINFLKKEFQRSGSAGEDAAIKLNPGAGNVVQEMVPPSDCQNMDFEESAPGPYTLATAVSGWSISSRSDYTCPSSNPWQPGSAEFSLVSTPVLNVPAIGTLAASPLGGTVVAQLNDYLNNNHATRLTRTLSVTPGNSGLRVAFAGILQSADAHPCCSQAKFQVNLYTASMIPLGCSSFSFAASGSSCTTANTGFSASPGYDYTAWQVRAMDLTPFSGTSVIVEIIAGDCHFSGHWGSFFIDLACEAQDACQPPPPSIYLPYYINFCPGATVATIYTPTHYPLAYPSLTWVAPGNNTLSPQPVNPTSVTVFNPVAGSVYTLYLTSHSGCQFVATYTLQQSGVSINCVQSHPGCPGMATGSATVSAWGSAGGYNYSWLSLTANSVAGTSSVATGLAPGFYSVTVTAFGSAGCGQAGSTVAVLPLLNQTPSLSVTASQSVICAGGQVTLTANGSASQYSWTNGPSQPVYVLNPQTSSVYNVTASDSLLLCSNSGSVSVNVFQPTVAVMITPTIVCSGENATLTASPALSYTWSGQPGTAIHVVQPLAGTVYTLQAGSFSAGIICVAETTAGVSVHPPPVITTGVSAGQVCAGDMVVLSAAGAVSYTWSTGHTTPSVTLSTVAGTHTFTVLAIDANGCAGTGAVSITVGECLLLQEKNPVQKDPVLYPNPASGTISISNVIDAEVDVYSAAGQLLIKTRISQAENRIDISGIPAGLYVLQLNDGGKTSVLKLQIPEVH